MRLSIRRLGQIFTVLALCASIGLHWAFLQSVAWTSMLLDGARGASLTEAVRKTFDGKNPCALCKFVQEGRETEKERQGESHGKKLDPALPTEPMAFAFQELRAPPAQPAWSHWHSRFAPPGIPPPRHARAAFAS